MKTSNCSFWTLTLKLTLFSSVSIAAVAVPPNSQIEALNLKHQATQDSWEWQMPNGIKVLARVCQDPGIHNQIGYAIFHLQTTSEAKVRVEYGLTPRLGQATAKDATPQKEHEIRLDGLNPRGTKYYVQFHVEGSQGSWSSPLLKFKTLLRYPYGYSFSPADPELRWPSGGSRVVIGPMDPYAAEVLKRVQEVNPESYLQHIILTITTPRMSQLDKVKAIMTFVGTAVQHSPLYLYTGPEAQAALEPQDVPGEPRGITLKPTGDRLALDVFEMHNTQCGYVNTIIAGLTRLVGVDGGAWPPPSGHHLSGRLLINGKWYFADEDAFKKGLFPLMPDGTLPPMDWIMQGDNIYLLDTKPGWVDWSGEWMLTQDGFLVTGDLAGGYDRSEDGYGSYAFAGRKEFPPSIPHPLPVAHYSGQSVTLEWVGSYDRDKDFQDYEVGVGTQSGLSDVGSYHAEHAFCAVKLPHPGAYYWRVKATDHHADSTPYAGKIFYVNSEESFFSTAKLPETPRGPAPIAVDPPEDVLFSLDPKDGSLGGLEREGNEEDGMAGLLMGWTDLFNIEWGEQGRVLELVDPSNRWRSGKIVTTSWHAPMSGNLASGEPWEMTAIARTGRSYIAGTSSFPFIYVTDRAQPGNGLGLSLIPEAGTVSSAVKEGICWTNLDAFDPQNEWHTYTLQFSGKGNEGSLTTVLGGRQANVVSFLVDGKKLGTGISVPEAITPGEVWVSSNPEAEVTAWISKIRVERMR